MDDPIRKHDGKVLLYRRNGLYQARIHLGKNDYIHRSLKTANTAEAERLAEDLWNDVRYELKKGLPVRKRTLNAVLDEYKRYVVMKNAWTRDDAGNKQRIQREKIVRAWFWPDVSGLSMVVRYGARPLELAKGKRALTVPSIDAIPEAISTVIAAVKAGELDTAMETAIAANKSKMGKA